ncbi:hypothetical protein GJ496_002706 [Pomphorhynchus laevis]|nr:hypothetical protein GJ496_002706 [Pomphorhynchus laevis]
MIRHDGISGSGWLLNPNAAASSSATSSSVNLYNTSSNAASNHVLLSAAASGIQSAASTLLSRVMSGKAAGTNYTSVTFDQWFFNGSDSADFYVLGAFLLFMIVSLVLSLPVFFLICTRSRTPSNSILFHYYLANWIFLLGQLLRFIRAQNSKDVVCTRLGQVGPWFYMDIISTPIAYIALALLAVERFVFYVGHSFPPLKWLRSMIVLTLTLCACWLLLAGLDVGIFLLLRMLSLSDFLRPVADTLSSISGGGLSFTDRNTQNSCADPLSGRILSPVRDILTALFVCTIALPAIGSVLMQTILHCMTCRTNRQPAFQRSTILSFGIIASHLLMSFPHTTVGIFVPNHYRALAWLLTIRALQHVLALALFMLLDQSASTLIFTYMLRRKPPALSSTLNRAGDIDTLIASVDVSPKTLIHAGHDDVTDNMSNGIGQHTDITAPTAQHPYLAIRPARLYFERPQSAFGTENNTSGNNISGINRNTTALNRTIGMYTRNNDQSFNRSDPAPFPRQGGLISPRPPPLPPRRWNGRPTRQQGSSSSVGNSRSLPSSRRRFSNRRNESHHDLGVHNRFPGSIMNCSMPTDQNNRPAHRLYQSDYRLSLCDERLITIDNSRSSPGGWFDCVITNEEEV